MSATRTMVREDTAIILNDDSVVSSFGFEKNLSTITAWVLILLLSYDKSTIYVTKLRWGSRWRLSVYNTCSRFVTQCMQPCMEIHRLQWTSTIRNPAGQQDGCSFLHQPSFSKAALELKAAFPVDTSGARATEFSSHPPHLRKVQYRIHIGYSASGSDCKHCD